MVYRGIGFVLGKYLDTYEGFIWIHFWQQKGLRISGLMKSLDAIRVLHVSLLFCNILNMFICFLNPGLVLFFDRQWKHLEMET